MVKQILLLAIIAASFVACTPAAEEKPAETPTSSAPEPSLDK